MPFAFTKLSGLDSDRLIAIIDPILSAHGVDGVELTWKTDGHGWLLALTIEKPGTTEPGAGVSLDECSRVSRSVSAALDEQEDLIGGAYRLEVGTPGVERRLYSPEDYTRFAGKTVKIKLHEPVDGEYWVRGELRGMDSEHCVVVATEQSAQKPARGKRNNQSFKSQKTAVAGASGNAASLQQQSDLEHRGGELEQDKVDGPGELGQRNEEGERIQSLGLSNIHSAQLVLEWGQTQDAKQGPAPGRKR